MYGSPFFPKILNISPFKGCWNMKMNNIKPPIFKAPRPWSSLPPAFFKNLFLLLYLLFYPLLRYFRHFPHPQTTSSCPNSTNQPSLLIINGFKQISKRWVYQFKCWFISKINFWFFKSLYGIFPDSFLDNLEWLFS